MPVIVVLEFCSACWAVCDAHGLCSCEYLFSELFVFSGACSAHRYFSSLFSFVCVCVRWWRVAASARRAPPPSNTTLFSSSLLLFFPSSPRFSLFWNGVCRVVRAQPCEHARNTTRASMFLVRLLSGRVLCTTTTCCCLHHTRSLLTSPVFNIEHCVSLITS